MKSSSEIGHVFPVSDEFDDPNIKGARIAKFQNDLLIISLPSKDEWCMSQKQYDKWLKLGGPKGSFGYPINVKSKGLIRFEHGMISREGFEIHGAILSKYEMLYVASELGLPTTDESVAADGVGRYNNFENGAIYWSPATGACEVRGAIYAKWSSLGLESGILGYPKTDELITPDSSGHYNHFQHGSIYWSSSTGANEVHGSIRDKWQALGCENSVLGYPTTDETSCPDGVGKYNHFQHGSIYWSPNTGAHEVHGDIKDKWENLGWETSYLGYPITDELPTENGEGRFNDFQNGSILWNAKTGARAVHGPDPQYKFVLHDFTIAATRSNFNDTVHVYLSVKIGDQPVNEVYKYLGDLNDGNYPVGLEIGPIEIKDPSQTITIQYTILNKNEGETAYTTCVAIADKLSAAAATSGDPWAMIIAGGYEWMKIILNAIAPGLFVPGACDGVCAYSKTIISADTLKHQTRYDGTGSKHDVRVYDGYDSPPGCRGNSRYGVSFSIELC